MSAIRVYCHPGNRRRVEAALDADDLDYDTKVITSRRVPPDYLYTSDQDKLRAPWWRRAWQLLKAAT